ncbi:hypothetical protein BDFB_000962 [Asbolus verrucosus]|uniref:Uncharacterized protein n=1 Tax=Asbolus verrucosus TaxID=1661398 RepID=A0A482W309_ASBVE|nr:hypothetical protein BDFB_000962 [Asbolus verrucosus]
MSPKHQIYDATKRQPNKRTLYNGNVESDTKTTTTSTTTPKTITETETSTRYTNTSYTTFSDNSDSAYTNSRSNFSESSNNNSTTPEIHKQIAEDTEVSNQDPNNSAVQLKTETPKFIKYTSGANETATQTVGTTNVNVISNVQLSQSTLDLIFNQVMQDVKNSPSSEVDVMNNRDFSSEPNIVQVKQIPSFYLKRKEDVVDNSEHSRIVKCMISNVGIGSPYTKPPEVPQIAVPRFSARPQTSSMEVNMSSGESTDKESDTVSLVDSLEDTSSLRTDPIPSETVVKSDVSLELPDNSDNRKTPSKPTAFFIPIEIENSSGFKAVSDHLPDKVRNRLARRQQKREEKLQTKSKQSSSRSDSNYISASDNGNHIHFIVDNGSDVNLNSVSLPEVNYSKSKKRSNKPLLPSIESFRRIKIDKNVKYDDKREQKINKSIKRKSVKENSSENVYNSKTKQSHWMPKVKNKNEKLSPLYTTKNEYVYDYGPRRIYHKTEFNNSNKRIEILEIMECVDTSEKLSQQFSKAKSKIPVLISHKLPKINQKSKIEKPTFLDLNNVQLSDPKLDQLIANILIETLNIPDIQASVSSKSPIQENHIFVEKNLNEKEPSETHPPPKHSPSPNKYQQKFEVIPEELSVQSSTENDFCNNNNESKNNKSSSPVVEEKSSYQGKAAVAVVKDENFSSIPKGWITFYMLHNNRGSPDSTSDEGINLSKKYQKS